VLSRGARSSRDGAGVRGRPEYGAGLTGGSGGAPAGLFTLLPLRRARGAIATR
jgi:hypothetical protein